MFLLGLGHHQTCVLYSFLLLSFPILDAMGFTPSGTMSSSSKDKKKTVRKVMKIRPVVNTAREYTSNLIRDSYEHGLVDSYGAPLTPILTPPADGYGAPPPSTDLTPPASSDGNNAIDTIDDLPTYNYNFHRYNSTAVGNDNGNGNGGAIVGGSGGNAGGLSKKPRIVNVLADWNMTLEFHIKFNIPIPFCQYPNSICKPISLFLTPQPNPLPSSA